MGGTRSTRNLRVRGNEWKVILGVFEWCWWDSWGEVMSKSATKALRAGVGGEERRGILTFLFACFGPVGVFVADLDKPGPPRVGRGGRSLASAGFMASASARVLAGWAVMDRVDALFDRAGPARAPPRAPRRRPDPRERHLTAENVC